MNNKEKLQELDRLNQGVKNSNTFGKQFLGVLNELKTNSPRYKSFLDYLGNEVNLDQKSKNLIQKIAVFAAFEENDVEEAPALVLGRFNLI